MARARHRKQHRPMKVTTWLTAGATTVGVGAALLSGAAIANAKPSSDSSSSASSSSSSHSGSSSGASSHKSHQHSPKKNDSGSSSNSGSSGGSSNSGSSGGSGSDSGSGSGSTSSAAAGSSSDSGPSTTSAANKTTKTAKAKRSNNKHARTDTDKKSASTITASDTSSDTSTGKHAKPANKHVAAAATDAADTSTTTASNNGASGSSSATAASALAAVSASATTASSTTTTGGTSTVKTTGTRTADFTGVLSVLAAVGQALSVSARNTELTLTEYVHNTELTLSHDLTGTAKTVNAAVTSLAAAVESLTHTSTTSAAATSTAVAGTANPAAGTDTDTGLYAGTSSDPQVAQALTEIQQAQAAYKAAAKTGNWWVNFCNSMSARYLSGALNRLTAYQENQDNLLAAYSANPTTKNYNALMANEKLTTTAYSNLKTAASWSKIADVKTYATAASADAHIYGTVSMSLYLGTESIVKISINGGPMVKVLLDSGSTGLVIASKYVGNDSTMTTTGGGTSAYGTGSGDTGVTFDYTTYTTSVSFGSGITGDSVTVNVVSAGTQSAFLKYIGQDGVVGVLGIGTNAVDNQVPVTSGLIGELGNGVYINEKTKTVTFGPNPLPVKVTASGTPNSTGYISVDGGTTLTPANFILDSGGVYGTITAGAAGNAATSTGYLAVGTVVSVYNSAGDLLYSYKVTKSNSPTVTADASTSQSTVDGVTAYVMNSGSQGFALGPVYIDYLNGTTTITTPDTDSDGKIIKDANGNVVYIDTTYTGETDYDLWTS